MHIFTRRVRPVCASIALAAVVALGAGACTSGADDDSAASSSAPAGTPTGRITTDDNLAAQLPDRIKASHTLIVGTNVPYAPNEFTDPGGRVVGFDVDVVNAVGQVLGIRPEFRQTPFEAIVGDVSAGRTDMGMRSLFDTLAREKQVDLVTYFSAGTQWAQQSGKAVDPNNACGTRVGVEASTVQNTVELPAKSKACTTVGEKPITAVPFDSQDAATAALTRGAVDAVSADSPVIADAVHKAHGALARAGEIFDTTPYGFPVATGSPLGKVLQAAVQKLIDSGEMRRIADRWGLGDGVIKHSSINGAIS